MLRLDARAGHLSDLRGRHFDPAKRLWIERSDPSPGEPIELAAAVGWLQRNSGHPLQVPVGVIGPRDATPRQLRTAEQIGARLAAMGLSIVCGGRQGVMEATCRGAASEGGITVGLLPEPDPSDANPFVTVAIATGIGEARNALIARSAFCLVAIGDSYGTLSEVALGLHFGKPVLGMEGAAELAGVRHFARVDELIGAVARLILAIED